MKTLGKSEEIYLVIPCYNEELRLNYDYWDQIRQIPNLRLLFIDDGSTDLTFKKLEKFMSYQNCNVIRSSRNIGKANAIRKGMKHLLADKYNGISAIGFLDSDGAVPVAEIRRFSEIWCNLIESGDFSTLWASRVQLSGRNISRSKSRHYLGRILLTIIMFRKKYIAYDTQCGFKIFRISGELESALEEPFITRWFFDVELFMRISKQNLNYRIYEEPLNSWRDISGSKINLHQSVRIAFESIKVRKILARL